MRIELHKWARPAVTPTRPRDGSFCWAVTPLKRCRELQFVLQSKVNKLRLRSDVVSKKITNVDWCRRLFTNCYQEISHEPYFRTSFV